MKERPILFSGPMVRAILEGRKTQTRRVMKGVDHSPGAGDILPWDDFPGEWFQWIDGEESPSFCCPYGAPGDRLWVRETCNVSLDGDAVMYRDYGGKLGPKAEPGSESWCREWKTCPSIHMPRWASRINLEITDVRVQRLQDISEEDARAEGVELICGGIIEIGSVPPRRIELTHRDYFQELWNRINGKRCPWESNPWVWAVSFKRASNA